MVVPTLCVCILWILSSHPIIEMVLHEKSDRNGGVSYCGDCLADFFQCTKLGVLEDSARVVHLRTLGCPSNSGPVQGKGK